MYRRRGIIYLKRILYLLLVIPYWVFVMVGSVIGVCISPLTMLVSFVITGSADSGEVWWSDFIDRMYDNLMSLAENKDL